MRTTILFLSVFFLSNLYAADNFWIEGKVLNMKSGKIVFSYSSVSGLDKYDTIKVNNGRFSVSGYISSPQKAYLDICMKSFWIEPGKMQIEIDNNNAKTIRLSGSKSQLENDVFDKAIAGVSDRKEIDRQKRKFIYEHPESFVSGSFLGDFLFNYETQNYDTLQTLYKRLSSIVKSGFDAKRIYPIIESVGKNRPGQPAPDFSTDDFIHHTPVTLSGFRGKVVLLDFWAGYCIPCRRCIKSTIRPLYQKYNKMGFEVIAVQTDFFGTDTEDCLKAIQTDSISDWHHIRSAENLSKLIIKDTDVFKNYCLFGGIPRKILIDRNGIIVHNSVGTSPESDRKLEELVEYYINVE